jgi:hypothetical protein
MGARPADAIEYHDTKLAAHGLFDAAKQSGARRLKRLGYQTMEGSGRVAETFGRDTKRPSDFCD